MWRITAFTLILIFLTLFDTHTYAVPVYIAKDSRVYHHDRNCSELNTDNLIKFKSSQQADSVGAIPCEYCNSSTYGRKDETKVDSDKGVYVGEYKNGRRHGQGTYTLPSGSEYMGGWKDGKKHGQGTFTLYDGYKYVGEWKDGKMHGHGTLTFPDGGKYVGGWKDDKKHGQGTYTYTSGNKYVGEYKDDKKHGRGTYTWTEGDKYMGGWKDGNEVGGWYYWPDGSKKWSYRDSQGNWVSQSEKEIEEKKREEEISKQVKELVQSFSIKGVKIGMPFQQVRELYSKQLDDFPYATRMVHTPLEDGSSLAVSCIKPGVYTKEPIVYKIQWRKNFKNYKTPNDIFMKLQKTYGKYSDFFHSNEFNVFFTGDSKNDHYYAIWGAKFLKNKKEERDINQLLQNIVIDNSREPEILTGKTYLMAQVISNARTKMCRLALQLHNYKIYEDARAAEEAKIKRQEDLDNLEFK